jgi:tyrosinase
VAVVQELDGHGLSLGRVTPVATTPVTAERMRKDARDLSEAEVTTLRTAFQGLMDRSPDDPTSYFAIAGQH